MVMRRKFKGRWSMAALRRLFVDRRGVSAVEFALILPLMLILYAGSVDLSGALTVDRKVNRAASTIGDLVAQETSISSAEMTNIFAATRAIMEPYPNATLRILVAVININSDGTQKVAWAQARNTTDPADGSNSPITIPAAIAVVGTQVVVTRVEYDYTSPFSSVMSSLTGNTSYGLEHTFMMRPRLGTTITWE